MYYAGLSANGSQSITPQGADKQGIYMSAAGPYGPAPAGYPQAQGQHPGLAQRFAAAPQTYAVVSNSGGHTGYTTISPAYHSLPYSMQSIPTTSHAYISAAQYPGMSYQTALGPRSAPPSPYSAPVQAGAPLYASGYSTMAGGMPAPGARSYTISTVPGYPQAYALPASYHGAMTYGPHY